MAREIKDLDTWYIDSYVLRHICNDKGFFSELRPKSYQLVTARREIIKLEEIDSVHFLTNTKATITLKNVTYMPTCNSNLILLTQLRELGITYHNHPKYMILKQEESSIRSASRNKNFFILDMKTTNKKVMINQRRG